LGNMPLWEYENRPTALAFHDLTTTMNPRPYLQKLLGLGLKFCPTPRQTHSFRDLQAQTFPRLRRALELSFFFAGGANAPGDYNPKMYISTDWTPPPWTVSNELGPRFEDFQKQLKKFFKPRKARSNLLPVQQEALSDLTSQTEFLVVPTDKNLGPSIIEREEYIRTAMRDHLNNSTNYLRLSRMQAAQLKFWIKLEIENWLKEFKDVLLPNEKKFIKYNLKFNVEPFCRFYLLLKVHKKVAGQPVDSRPIVSTTNSYLHPLGVFVDDKLKVVAQKQPSYLKSSFDLKQKLSQLDIPPFTASLFTADAVAMYTNIPQGRAFNMISAHLRDNAADYAEIPIEATLKALKLIMTKNVFTFGDMTFLQRKGTAMGTPPAPQIATIYYATEEAVFLPLFQSRLLYYCRYLDDTFGIWIHHPDPAVDAQQWQAFQDAMNSNTGLTWKFSPRTNRVDFLDLTVTVKEGIITTTLYEKPLNLHLYIPPHSAHAPGLLPGIVYCTLFRIHTLCSAEEDKDQRTRTFYYRLKARGYQAEKLLPLFQKAIERAKVYTGPAPQASAAERPVFFHLQYHPQDPSPSVIQKAWRETVLEPKYKRPLWALKNPQTEAPCNVRRMIIAYKRPMNLGNLLSHRDLNRHPNHQQPNALPGPPVSSYYEPD